MQYRFTHRAYMGHDEVANLYETVKLLGLRDVVFYDGEVKNWRDWIVYVKDAWLCKVQDDQGVEVGFFWLNGCIGKTGMIHFVIYDLPFAEAVELGKQTVRYCFKHTGFESLYGCTPKPYRHVFKYIQALGFRLLGELPGACYMKRKDRHVPGVISVCVPQEVPA